MEGKYKEYEHSHPVCLMIMIICQIANQRWRYGNNLEENNNEINETRVSLKRKPILRFIDINFEEICIPTPTCWWIKTDWMNPKIFENQQLFLHFWTIVFTNSKIIWYYSRTLNIHFTQVTGRKKKYNHI